MMINGGTAVAIMKDTVTAYEAKREKYWQFETSSTKQAKGNGRKIRRLRNIKFLMLVRGGSHRRNPKLISKELFKKSFEI